MGGFIGVPFFLWLLVTLFDFGNIDQLFAFLAVVGLIITFINLNSRRSSKILLLDILCFGFLASPIIRRMTVVPFEKFNYLAFIIPTILFVLLYFLSICISFKTYLQIQK